MTFFHLWIGGNTTPVVFTDYAALTAYMGNLGPSAGPMVVHRYDTIRQQTLVFNATGGIPLKSLGEPRAVSTVPIVHGAFPGNSIFS